jgi:hypothetical protein
MKNNLNKIEIVTIVQFDDYGDLVPTLGDCRKNGLNVKLGDKVKVIIEKL